MTIVCNTGGGVIPSLRINGDPTDDNNQVIAGPSSSTRTFYFIFATQANNGIEFTCSSIVGSIVLDVLCK